MKITWASQKKIDKVGTELIAVPFRTKGKNLAFETLEKKTRKALLALAKAEGFKGQEGRTLLWQGKLAGRITWIMVLGMSTKEESPAVWRRAVSRAMRFASGHCLKSISIFVDGTGAEKQIEEVRWTTEGILLAAYRFGKYKSKAQRNNPPKEGIIGVYPAAADDTGCRQAIKMAKAAATGVTLARDLINEPSNLLSPDELANRAKSMADKKGLACTVFGAKKIRQMGMNLLLAVAAGSERDPRLIHLVYRPRNKATAVVAIVGKGVTFDSGGLCIKPGKSMYDMKTDMAGASTVLGIMSAVKAHKPKVEVHGIIPATDNVIGGNATRPGDVVKSLSGFTVEILNTDAEGRLILADALTYAQKLKPDIIIDHATLTGACVAALGPHRAGLFSSDNDAANAYIDAAKKTGELFWRLPLSDELVQDLKSDVADIKNIGSSKGGAITASLFLKRFVEKTPWIHLDIAGPARAEKATSLCPKGGSGFGVLTALEYLQSL